MYREVDGVIYLGESRIGNADVVGAIYTTWLSGKSSSNVLKEIGTDKLLIRNDLNNMVILNKDAIKSFIDNRVIEIEKEEPVVIEPETTVSIKKDVVEREEDIDIPNVTVAQLFDKDMSTEKYYYMLLAEKNSINPEFIGKVFDNYGVEKTALLVETEILSQLGVVESRRVDEYINIASSKVIDSVKDTLIENRVRFKVGSIVDIQDIIRSGINENLMFPLYSGVQKAPKLKTSKVLEVLDKEFKTDVRLKYLKVKQVLSSSRSIKLTVKAYNSLLRIFSKETGKDLVMYSIKSVKMERYNKEYAEGLKYMIKMLDLILEAYLNKTYISVETTGILVALNKCIRK